MAAIRSLYKLPQPHATTYTHLHADDITALASILSHHPAPHIDRTGAQHTCYVQMTKRQIAALPIHLHSSLAHTLTGALTRTRHQHHSGAARLRTGALCALHGRLSARLARSILAWLRHELDTAIPAFLAPLRRSDALAPALQARFRALDPVPEMWRDGAEPALGALQGRRVSCWQRQEDGCAACVVARIGADAGVCAALLAGMVARMRAERVSGGRSGRVRWVEAWLRGFEGGEALVREAWAVGEEVKEVRRRVRRAQSGRLEPQTPLPMSPGSPDLAPDSSTAGESGYWDSSLRQAGEQPPLWGLGAAAVSGASPYPSQNPYSESVPIFYVPPADATQPEEWDSGSAHAASRSGCNTSSISLGASSVYSQPTNAPSTYTNPSSLDEYAGVSINDIPPLPPLFARDEWAAYQEALGRVEGAGARPHKAEQHVQDYGSAQNGARSNAGPRFQRTAIPAMRSPSQPNPFTQGRPRASGRSAAARRCPLSPLVPGSGPVREGEGDGYADVSPVYSDLGDVPDRSSTVTRWSGFYRRELD